MKKVLFLSLLVLSFSLIAAPKSGNVPKPDDDDVTEINLNYIPPVVGPKRAPSLTPISATYYGSSSYIEICFLYDIGDVNIVITNLATGSNSSYSVSSLVESISIPFINHEGIFSIEFYTSTGLSYFGYLSL